MDDQIPAELRADVEALWEYHDLRHRLRPVDIGIGLGSHDPGVAEHTAELYHAGMFARIVFTGGNAPTTVDRFPRGEAVHYREYAVAAGVPAHDVLVEPRATNTGENFTLTRELLDRLGVRVRSAIVVSRPYQRRRAYATARKVWPELDVVCSAQPIPVDEYVAWHASAHRVINMLVGDTQRVMVYAERGFAIPQQVPPPVRAALLRLIEAGYTERLIAG